MPKIVVKVAYFCTCVSGVKTTSVMLKTTKKTDYATRVHVATLQLLNFHISRKRMSVKLLQPYITFFTNLGVPWKVCVNELAVFLLRKV